MPGKHMNNSQNSRNKMEPFKPAKTFSFVYKSNNVKIKTSWGNKIERRKHLVKKGINNLLL